MHALVIDTNVVLDLFVFEDTASAPLRHAIERGAVQWLATAPMRDELLRVLDYPQIARRLGSAGAAPVLAAFDDLAQPVPVAPRAAFACKDADDQKFIDLAQAHRAALLSKDAAVLCMARRLSRVGVAVWRAWPSSATPAETA